LIFKDKYLLFSDITPTVPTDPKADVLVYVTVDVFGTVRSRFDALAYNNETIKAETSFEFSAFMAQEPVTTSKWS
jgi:hypothetical protein